MKPSRPAQQRLLAMTNAVKHCEAQAKAYGKCVEEAKSPKLNECVKEFEALSACMKQARDASDSQSKTSSSKKD